MFQYSKNSRGFTPLRSKRLLTGFTLIETMIGLSLLSLVIIGIYGGFQFSLKVIAQSRARTTATALANQKIELARNLAYADVGTVGGIPAGSIPETEIITRNNVEYTVKTTVSYVDDPFDGTAPADAVPNDYKKVKIKVTWTGLLGGEVTLISSAVPKGLESSEGGGNLLISAFDAVGLPIVQADIHVVNTEVNPPIDASYLTNNQGQYLVAGAPNSTSAYQITVSKDKHSASRTYGIEEVANPAKPHTTVLEGQLTEISFAIDRVSSFAAETHSPWGSDSFTDSFPDSSQIAELSDAVVDAGQIRLATTTASTTQYVASGHAVSATIAPELLNEWQELAWDDNEPVDTDIGCHLLYATGTEWELVPDGDLAGNAAGFDSSPVDLSALSIAAYPQIRIKGALSTVDASTTPALLSWSVSWKTDQATPLSDVSFNLRGHKTIGTDGEEEPVYKYSEDFISDADGLAQINNLEWDQYNFVIDPAENLDLISTNPASDPVGENVELAPNTIDQSIILMLDAENGLLVNVRDAETLEPIFGAQTRLSQAGLGYDETKFVNEKGQVLFMPLEAADYSLNVQADDHTSYNGVISVSGDKTVTIYLIPVGPS